MLLEEDIAPSTAYRNPSSPTATIPEPLAYRLKNAVLGPPLHSDRLDHETLGRPTALAVFASDCMSSCAYATEEILRVLVIVIGVAAFSLVTPITIALLVVLGFLILSTARRSRLTRRRAVRTSSPATTSACCRPRSPASPS